MIAALYINGSSCYAGLPDVDPWSIARDARLYDGPHPVIAHTPCQRPLPRDYCPDDRHRLWTHARTESHTIGAMRDRHAILKGIWSRLVPPAKGESVTTDTDASALLMRNVDQPIRPRALKSIPANQYCGLPAGYLEKLRQRDPENGPQHRRLPSGTVLYLVDDLDKWLVSLPVEQAAFKRGPRKKRATECVAAAA